MAEVKDYRINRNELPYQDGTFLQYFLLLIARRNNKDPGEHIHRGLYQFIPLH